MSETDGQKLAYPNIVPRKLFGMIKQLAKEMEAPGQKRVVVEEAALTAIILGASTVEAFTNIYFRLAVDDSKTPKEGRERVLADLKTNLGDTRGKLAHWTKLVFGRDIPKEDARWIAYDEMLHKRNKFVHFKVEPQAAAKTTSGQKVFDISIFDALSKSTPRDTLETILGVVSLVGECSGEEGGRFIRNWLDPDFSRK